MQLNGTPATTHRLNPVSRPNRRLAYATAINLDTGQTVRLSGFDIDHIRANRDAWLKRSRNPAAWSITYPNISAIVQSNADWIDSTNARVNTDLLTYRQRQRYLKTGQFPVGIHQD